MVSFNEKKILFWTKMIQKIHTIGSTFSSLFGLETYVCESVSKNKR